MPVYTGLLRRLLLATMCYLSGFSAFTQVTADFSATPLSGCAPLLVRFNDLSTGSPNSWNWDLGNGTFSVIPSPSVTYFTPGTYNIKLVVRNAAGNADSITKNSYITVYARPEVNFSASDTIGCYPLQTQFTDLSTPGSGTITNWQWDFGDGITSTLQNPSHTYLQGTFSVVLRVRNENGCNATFIRTNYIRAVFGAQADFIQSTTGACNPPVTVNFTNTSTGSGTLTYQWNFGDGNTSTLQNPVHNYTTAGAYTVQLIVVSSAGCTDTIIKNNTVNIGVNDAAFTSLDSICEDAPLTFTNTSVPAPVTAAWNFGDGTTSAQINPVKTFATPGVYTVSMVAGFGGCSDSVLKNITVLAKPTADFNAPNRQACKAPFTVNFNNTSSAAVSYNWNFGDGNTSTTANPSHTYNAAGEYDVTLTVTNALGCTDSIKKIKYVVITPPQLSFVNLPDSGCTPLTIAPVVSIATPDIVTSYSWNFGDGFTSTAANPVHTYTTAGTFAIQLIITTSTGCTDSVSSFVKAGNRPDVNFSATPLNACAREPIIFNDLTTANPPATSWYWQFGDGTTSTNQNPVHFYNDTGWFSITLIVGNNGCYDTLLIPNYIYINPPIARFSPTVNCADPYTFSFADQSIAPLTWAWLFGDGNSSTQPSPVHTYTAPGNYVVELTVTNGACTHTTSMPIRVLDVQPDFIAFPLQVCKSTQVTFSSTNYLRPDIVSFQWNFGDGTIVTGNDSSVTHAYQQSGTYTIQLITTDALGCLDTVTKIEMIRVFGPSAGFSVTAPGTCNNSAVLFNDLSLNDGLHPITQWIWNYGDGIIDTLTAPPFLHQYASGGVYTVSLKVTDNTGCADSITRPGYVIISRPIAGFDTPDTLSCPGKPIVFSNNSSGPSLSFEWNFGDGNTSTQITPIHQYTADGTYTVTLIIRDLYGCADTIVKNQYIKIRSARALFTASDTLGTCPPLFVTFDNQSQFYTSWLWSFGDGATSAEISPSHFYTTPGIFTAKLVISVPGGCTDSLTQIIRLQGPSGNFSYTPLNGCDPLTVNFTATALNTMSYVWDFNNGQTLSSSGAAMSYTYNLPGKYLPRVILEDGAGCNIPVLGLDSISVFGVAAQAEALIYTLCDSGFVNFRVTHTGNDPVAGYLWNFGDGNTSTIQNPSHRFIAPGNYQVQCIVTTARGCSDTARIQTPIRIIQSPLIDIAGSNEACVPAQVQFSGQILRVDTSTLTWQWDFGNGQTSTLINPPVVNYTIPGVYTIRSIATNSSGCSDTVYKTFTVWALPIVDAGPAQQICRGTPKQLNATGASNYIWSPSIGLSCTNCPQPLASPDSSRMYYLQGTDIHTCVNRDSTYVTVIQPFIMQQSPGVEICAGKTINLDATGANTYIWSPATGLSGVTGNRVLARPNTTTNYRVVGYDRHNCFTDTGYILVTVNPIPVVNAGPDVTITGGNSVTIPTQNSADVTAYQWTPGNTLSCFNCKNPVATPNQTTTYRVEVTNNGGCKNTDEITVFVLCGKDNLFIPNTFSPNGDGVNDKLYPRGNGIYTIKSFKIFNRWGELVFEAADFAANDESKAWNGTYKGKTLNPDVYVYMIEVICNNKNVMGFKGNVSLIK
jgi:gliding motility-associated-like protein